EYTTLLHCPRIQVDKVYSRDANVLTFTKKLTKITGMSEQWVAAQIKQKGENKCIPWKSLRDQILAHLDTKKRVDVFALSIYGLVIFRKALGHIDEAVTDLFDQLDRMVTLVPAILAETFRFLSVCRRTGEGRFIGCKQLLLVWFHSHFWKMDKELSATLRCDDITEERWMTILQNLQDEEVEWRAPWMVVDEIWYHCGDFDWVPLLRIWGAIGYAPLFMLRQYRSRQLIPATQGLAECEFSYSCNNYRGKIRKMSNAWKQIHPVKRITVGATTTPEYHWWRSKRINDNIPRPREERKIEQLEEEKLHLGLDVDIHKMEAEKLRKGKNKAEEDLD
ncbi:hypothetical protein Goari_022985, partial [Gossypium aridum]|nr:hypothetical protein [Gossypium aridum]